jgi:hypothetical protein
MGAVAWAMRQRPSTSVTRIHRYCEPLRHPTTPGLSLSGIRLVIPDHAMGLPVLRTLSLCTCRRHYPGAASGLFFARPPSRVSLPRKGCRVGLRIVRFEACLAFTHVAACTLARSPIRDPLSEGFSHFVASMTAPVASGWSDSPGGPRTHWRVPPSHGAHPKRTFHVARSAIRTIRSINKSRADFLVSFEQSGRQSDTLWFSSSARLHSHSRRSREMVVARLL